jgi:hypothetical protein
VKLTNLPTQHLEVLHHEQRQSESRYSYQEDVYQDRKSGRATRGATSSVSGSSPMMEDESDSFAYASERNRGRDHQLFSKLLNAQEFIRREKEENYALRTILQLLR